MEKVSEDVRHIALGLHDDQLPNESPGRDDMLQLYSWSLEDARQAQEKWCSDQQKNISGLEVLERMKIECRGPLFKWVWAQELAELYHIYQTEKSPGTILEALFVCFMNSLPVPRWCESGYITAYRKKKRYTAKSWDDVFGSPHPKGTHLGAKKNEREKSPSVYVRITELKKQNPSIPIDRKMFEDIGHEFGICKTLAEEYYYKWKNELEKSQ